MTTEITTLDDSYKTGVSIYDRVDPLEFIEKIGKVFAMTGAGGCKTESDGKLMALACVSERKTIFDIARRYHLMDGKLVTKAEAMLADFKKRGGTVRWIKTGCDGIEAVLELSLDKVTEKYGFSIETAQKAGYVKDKSNWVKRPDQMLRSRCITDLMRMQWPEISDGNYSEDEISDMDLTASVATPSIAKTSRTKEEVAKKAAEYKAAEKTGKMPEETKKTAPAEEEKIVDAEIEAPAKSEKAAETPAAETTTEKPPFDVDEKTTEKGDADESTIPSEADSTFTAEVLEIQSLVEEFGWKEPDIVTIYNKQYNCSAANFGEFSDEQRATILTKLRAVKEKHRDKLAAAQ